MQATQRAQRRGHEQAKEQLQLQQQEGPSADSAEPSPSSPPAPLGSSRSPTPITSKWQQQWQWIQPSQRQRTALLYRVVSLSLLLALLVQPQWLRVSLWRRVRGLAADERTFAVASAVAVHTGAYVSANLLAATAYWWQPQWLSQFRVQPQSPWPWQLRGGERSAYRRLVVRSLLLVAANLLLIAPALLWLAFPVQRAAGLQCGLDSLPTWWTSAAQMALLAVVEDTIFYVRRVQGCSHSRCGSARWRNAWPHVWRRDALASSWR